MVISSCSPAGPLAAPRQLTLSSSARTFRHSLLFKYVPHQRVRELALRLPLTDVPEGLVQAARLKSGGLQDDIAVIVAGQRVVEADGRASS